MARTCARFRALLKQPFFWLRVCDLLASQALQTKRWHQELDSWRQAASTNFNEKWHTKMAFYANTNHSVALVPPWKCATHADSRLRLGPLPARLSRAIYGTSVNSLVKTMCMSIGRNSEGLIVWFRCSLMGRDMCVQRYHVVHQLGWHNKDFPEFVWCRPSGLNSRDGKYVPLSDPRTRAERQEWLRTHTYKLGSLD